MYMSQGVSLVDTKYNQNLNHTVVNEKFFIVHNKIMTPKQSGLNLIM